MGMPVVIEAAGTASADNPAEQAFSVLREADRVFSTYKTDSDISRINRGEITVQQAAPEVAEVLELCDQMTALTNGWFVVRGLLPVTPSEPDPIDPSGYVKGWAIDRAGAALDSLGSDVWSINAGGDVLVRGAPQGESGWRIGIQHPLQRESLAAVVELRDMAIATSGAYERGNHVRNPHTDQPPSGLLSVSVVGPDIALADAFATTAFAMGREGASWSSGLPGGYEALSITSDQRVLTTAGFNAVRVS